MKTADLSFPSTTLSAEDIMELFNHLLAVIATQKRQADKPKFIGIREFCALTGYSKSTVYKLVSEHKVPFHRAAHGGRKIFFKPDEIEEWLTQNSECTVSDYCKEMDLKLTRSNYNYNNPQKW